MRADQFIPHLANPDSVAVHWVDRDRTLTFAEAEDSTNQAARVLSQFGVSAGSPVALFAHPGLDYVVGLLGTWRLGATAVLVGLDDKTNFDARIAATEPEAVVYTNDHFEFVESAMASRPECSFAAMDGAQSGAVGWLETLSQADSSPLLAPGNGVAPAIIQFGPDGAVVSTTHEELLAAAAVNAERLGLTADEKTLCSTPLHGRFHLEASLLPALSRGASAGLLKTWVPAEAWEAMDQGSFTVMCGTADHCAELLEASIQQGRPPRALRVVITPPGSAIASLTREFNDQLGVEVVTT